MAADPIEVSITSQRDEIRRVHQAVAEFGTKQGLDDETRFAIDLAVEEVVANVMDHACPNGSSREILVRLRRDADVVVAEVEDDGSPFNPLDQPAPDLSLPLEQRLPGGMGIHLVRSFMDELAYSREHNRNRFTMTKRLSAGTSVE